MNKRKFLAGLTVIVISLLALMGCKGAVEPSLSNDSSLVSLTVTGAIISPVFSASVTAYTATVPYTTTGVTVSASAASTASVAIKGSTSPKLVPLNVGSNIINVVVTAEDGSTKTYTVTITREAGSSSADLATLEVTGATISPAFSAGTVAYTATVPYATASATVTATVAQPSSSVKINGLASPQTVALTVGVNTITVLVTAEDGSTKTYTVTITREAGSSPTDLATLEVTGATISPVFTAAETNYTALVPFATTSVTVRATAAKAASIVKINGFASPQTVPLIVGENTVTVLVTAEDATTKTYTILITRDVFKVPVNYLVVESINGTVLPGAVITVLDVANNSLAATATSDANGRATINLPPDAVYWFFSDKEGYAENCYQSFNVAASGGNSVVMVNQRLGMINREASAPIIGEISVSHDFEFDNFTEYTGESINTTAETYMFVTFVSKEAVAPTAWSGFGAKLDFNRTPTSFNGIAGNPLGEPFFDSGSGMYVAMFYFDISGLAMPAGSQNAVIVGYDVANNRVEQSTPVLFTDSMPVGNAISAYNFTNLNVSMGMYPVSLGVFGKKPGSNIMALKQYAGKDVSYRAQLSFKFESAANVDQLISGFHVYRSTNNSTFTKIGSQLYPVPSTGSGGVHSFFDADSQLVQDTVYYYKVVAFTNATQTKESSVVQSFLSAPFSAELTTPLNRGTMSKTSPHDYRFTLSNTSLWSRAKSDCFCFALTLKEKSGAWKFIGQFRYNFITGDFEAFYSNDGVTGSYHPLSYFGMDDTDISYLHGTITIKNAVVTSAPINWAIGPAMEYQSGVAYQWDISGDVAAIGGAGQPCWFEKSTVGGTSRSYGNGYSEGGNAVNGLFEFSVVE